MQKMVYKDELIERINTEVSLVDYVGKTTELRKANNNYFAHCTKHTDKTPSLSFNAGNNLFYCFSCGRGGGFIKYLMEYEGYSFDDAVKKGASILGIHGDLETYISSGTVAFLRNCYGRKKGAGKDYTHEVLGDGELDKYKKELPEEWLNEGIDGDVMAIFGIMIDTAKDRIVYPVKDKDGRLINIKGRTRNKNYKALHIPKYINYYPVGELDYFQGMDITMPYIKEKGEVIIFESIKSVMKAYGWGYKNCVSAENHILTKAQIKILLNAGADVVLALDSDISYNDKGVKAFVSMLKRFTNVYLVCDRKKLLGGKDAKNAPVDLGKDIWERLYAEKEKAT